jgi:hypothetical protein
MRLGTRNIRNLYRSGSLTTAAREIAKYNLDLVGVQKVRRDEGGTVRAGDYSFIYRKENELKQLGIGFLVQHRVVSAVTREGFVSDRISYIVLRGRRCHIAVLNVHSPTEEKSDESKDSLYEELEQGFDHFPKYHKKIRLGYFNAKFKCTFGNEILHHAVIIMVLE